MSVISIPGKPGSPANKIIESLLDSKVVSPDGMNWLITALDPFHDDAVHLSGYPDLSGTSSIVQCVSLTTSIAVPSSVSSPNNYDANIFFTPISLAAVQNAPSGTPLGLQHYSAQSNYSMPNSGSLSNSGSPIIYPGLTIVTGATGTNIMKTGTSSSTLAMPSAYCSSNFRLVAAGFEVVNTTSELYIQGSVTSYRSPSPFTTAILPQYETVPTALPTSSTTTPVYASVSNYNSVAHVTVSPPFTQAEAQLYPSSKTWNAKEGSYMVATLNDISNKILVPSPINVMIFGNDYVNFAPQGGSTYTDIWYAGQYNNSGSTSQNYNYVGNVLPFDFAGSYFGGLSYQTTLQVTVRYYIEVFPTFRDLDLVVLADPACPYDPVALELYTRCLSSLPTAVMVKENPLGEWFKKALEYIAKRAPKVGRAVSTVFGPSTVALGEGVGTLAKTISTMIPRQVVNQGKQQPKNKPVTKYYALPDDIKQPSKKKSTTKPKVKVVWRAKKKAD